MNNQQNNEIAELNHKMMFSINPGPIILAVDTYEGLKKYYTKEEALKLTKIACDNYYKQLSLEKEDIEE